MTIMRKTYTLIVMLAMLFVGVNNASAQTSYTDEQGVTYSIGDTYATVTGYTGSATDVVIPATIGEAKFRLLMWVPVHLQIRRR